MALFFSAGVRHDTPSLLDRANIDGAECAVVVGAAAHGVHELLVDRSLMNVTPADAQRLREWRFAAERSIASDAPAKDPVRVGGVLEAPIEPASDPLVPPNT